MQILNRNRRKGTKQNIIQLKYDIRLSADIQIEIPLWQLSSITCGGQIYTFWIILENFLPSNIQLYYHKTGRKVQQNMREHHHIADK